MGFGEIFVKVYLIAGCFFDIALGIACIVLSSKSQDVDEDLFPEDDQKDYKDKFSLALYILGGVTIATGLLGIYGFVKKNRCLQTIFIILNILYAAAFGAIFGVSIYAKNYINDQMTDEKCKEGDLGNANLVFEDLKKVWCDINPLATQIACPCLATNLSQWTEEELSTIKSTKNAFRQDKYFVPLPSETISDCNYFLQNIAEQKKKEIKLIKAVERNFSCTGVCSGDLVYYFNNINSGRPENSDGCYKQIRSKLTDWAQYIYIISIIIAVACFLNVLFAFINCCIGNKGEKKYSETKRVEQF